MAHREIAGRGDSLGLVGQFPAATRLLDSLQAAATAREDGRLRNAVQVSRIRSSARGPLLEEPMLIARFGEDYEEYRRNVPRWIPRHEPWTPG